MDYSKFGGDASDDDGLYNSSFQLSHLFSYHEFDRFFVNFKTCKLQNLITQCKYNSQTKFGEGNIFTGVYLSTDIGNNQIRHGIGHVGRTLFSLDIRPEDLPLPQGSHSTWKTWKNESTPGKPGNIMEF